MRMRSILVTGTCIAAVLVATAGRAADPLSKEQLLELVSKGVDKQLILSLVEKDCVAFDVDAATLIELSGKVPDEVLKATIACRSTVDSLESMQTPPGTTPEAAEIALSADPPFSLSEVKRVAIVPFVLDGSMDESLTAAFREQVEERASHYVLEDAFALAVHFEDSGAFHSNAPIKSLLAAGRAVEVQALFIGSGTTYSVLGSPSVRLEVKLVEVRKGQVLWSGGGASKGGAWSLQQGKKRAARAAAKKLP